MIQGLSTPIRSDSRPARLVVIAAAAVVALLASACGNSDDSADPVDNTTTTLVDVGDDSTTTTTPTTSNPTTTTTTTTTTEPLTLEGEIVANMQGAQRELLDVWTDRDYGVVFFHHGDWASEVAEGLEGAGEGTGDYCERGTYAWSVADAKSESEFTIHYDALIEDPDCLSPIGIERLTAVFTGSREVDGRIVYDFGYTAGIGTPEQPLTGTRTVCSDQWNDPEPCGLALPGFEMSTPPQG